MGSFVGDFLGSGRARTAYLKGVELYGPTPIENLIPDPARSLPVEVGAAVRRALELLDPNANLPARRVTFDRAPVDAALADVGAKLRGMFADDSPFSYADAVGPLLDALGTLNDAIKPMTNAFAAAGAAYLRDVGGTRPRELPAAQQRVDDWKGKLENWMLALRVAGRNATVASAVVLEHEAVAFNEAVDVTWARTHLADTAEQLYQRAGDLPTDLKLRDSDDDLAAYVGLASEGLQNVTIAPGGADVLSQFKTELGAIEDPAAGHRDPNAFLLATYRVDELLYQLNASITELAKHEAAGGADRVTPLENALATSMVLCEGVRGVLDMKRGGLRVSRSQEEQELGRAAYEQKAKSARDSRDSRARLFETALRRGSEPERKPDPDHDEGRRR